MTRLTAVLRFVAMVIVGSCAEPVTPLGPPTPERILFTVTPSVADTITSPAVRTIVATVTDASGRPIADTVVLLSSSLAQFAPALTVSLDPNVPFFSPNTAETRTDAAGKGTVYARLGSAAGTHYVIAEVWGTNVKDSVAVTILPGKPHTITATPGDSAIYVGAQYQLGVTVTDRGSNVLQGTHTVQSVRTDVLSLSGGQVTAVGVGRGILRITAGGIGGIVRDAPMSVIPPGRLAANTSTGILIMDTDGGNSTTIAGVGGGALRWSPAADRLVFHRNDRVFASTLQGTMSQITPASYGIVQELQPQFSRDGAWIYYSASPAYDKFEIWGILSNGTSPVRIGPAADVYNHDTSPSPSPSGDRVVFATNRVLQDQGLVLQVITLASGAISPINIRGHHPRWSPNSEEIAYITGNTVRIVNANGTNDRLVSTSTIEEFGGGVDWSPDGQWLITCAWGTYSGERRLVLIRASTGEELPLPYTASRNLCIAAWRP